MKTGFNGEKVKGGCIFVSATTEFSERPGKVRDFLLAQQQSWIESLKKIGISAIKVRDFRDDIDCEQFAFDLYSLLMGYNYYSILLRTSESKRPMEKALNRLIESYQ